VGEDSMEDGATNGVNKKVWGKFSRAGLTPPLLYTGLTRISCIEGRV